MQDSKSKNLFLTVLAALLLAGGAAYFAKGVHLPWTADNDTDMRMRWDEYALFERGLYPHRRVAEAAGVAGVQRYTIYPPYAFPMFAAVFWPRTFQGARVGFQLLTVAALVVMMWYGARGLSFAGRAATFLGSAMPFAFSGNCTALRLGQFSIICTGFLVLQILLLTRDRPAWAGVCWAFAMIKPQIALPFAALFLVGAQWRGLLASGALLAGLTGLALWWTNIAPSDFWVQGVASHKLGFAAQNRYAAGLWIDALGLNPRHATLAALGVVAAFGGSLLLPQVRRSFTIETAGAVCAVMAYTLFYHLHYDNVVLFPLLLPLVAAVLRTKSPFLAAAAAILAITVYLPAGVVVELAQTSPLTDWIVLLAPAGACVILLMEARSSYADV